MRENRSIFHTGVATLQAIFRTVKHARMLLIIFLKSTFIFIIELLKFYHFFTKNNGIITNDIEENVLFNRVVRDIPH